MNIQIEHLEDKFLSTALKNGLSYWKKDQFEIIHNSATSLKAKVFGSDEYLTEMMFLGNYVTDVNCNCPNNRTLFCKHVAILYYEKLKEVLELKKSKPRKTAAKSKVAGVETKKTFSIEEAVDNLSLNELKEIILKEIKSNQMLRDTLEHKLSPKNKSVKELYGFHKTQIQQLIKKHQKNGYINYSASNKIGNVVIDMAKDALKHYEKNSLEACFEICRAIIEVMLKPLYYTDTSSGIFYQGLDEALSISKTIAEMETLSTKLRKYMYGVFLKLFKDNKNHGWGYEVYFVDVLILLADSESQKEELISAIHDNGIENYTVQLYNIIRKFEGEEAGKNFVLEHKTLPEFRQMLFDDLLQKEDYKGAKDCMLEGINVNKEFKGVVIGWLQNLHYLADLTDDRELLIKTVKILFLEIGFNSYKDSKDYYSILKEQFTKKEWQKECALLLNQVQDKSTLEEIYYREENFELLFKSIAEDQDHYFGANYLNLDIKYIKSLIPKYEEPLRNLLLDRITKYIDLFQGKKYYIEVCRILVSLKKQGMDIDHFILSLKVNYQRRPSLMARLEEFFG
ncbi:hypothetical protein [Snuella lapsa]|uniref:SWIM-type domain-containing protein n=1 Tax=Snuella lapsa TaxID=870481 RepID=A0ABP6XPF3_9FLAO